MNLIQAFSISGRALKTHKTRAFLASLGIVVGISAVIIMVAVGKGSQKEALDIIQSMGENLLTINAGEAKRRGGRLRIFGNVTTLRLRDAWALKEEDVIARVVPFEYKTLNVKYSNSVMQLNVGGTVPEFLQVRKYDVENGEMFDETAVKTAQRVAILGRTAVDTIFGFVDPIGKTFRIKTIPFKVIGVFRAKGVDTDGVDQDDIVVVPLTTMMRRVLNQKHINTLYVQAVSRDKMGVAAEWIRETLRTRHKLRDNTEDDFIVQNQVELEKLKLEAEEMFTALIVGVAAISLVVGGIGVLAVMLISVKERTREIGVRRAIGATRKDIVRQFLAESTIIGTVGGCAGVILGISLTLCLSYFGPWTLILDQKAAVISTLVCMIIGVFFGMYPAFKASYLDPMDALRKE